MQVYGEDAWGVIGVGLGVVRVIVRGMGVCVCLRLCVGSMYVFGARKHACVCGYGCVCNVGDMCVFGGMCVCGMCVFVCEG